MSLDFAKYEGAGNDFLIIDNRSLTLPDYNPDFIRAICQRRLGVGADGLIAVEHARSSSADVRMRIFNADGSEAEMCGNGIRCFYRFLEECDGALGEIRVETMERELRLRSEGDFVACEMGAPTDIRWDHQLSIDGWDLHCQVLNTGVPHAVLWVEAVEGVNLAELGPLIRHHRDFAPEGVNVNVASRGSQADLHVRTYERGVEGETLACGTGATAVGLAYLYRKGLPGEVALQVASGERLLIRSAVQMREVWMLGPARKVYAGTLLPASFAPETAALGIRF